jgi:epoxyqueuosine reductase
MKITSTRIKEIAGFHITGFANARGGPGPGGLDALEVIPVPDLGQASAAAYAAVESGFIPERYGWTREKTERAYRLKGYGQWARSVIVAAKYYLTDEEPPSGGSFGPIARFTWRNNYRYIVNRLSAAVKELSGALGRPIRSKIISNYTAVPEKALFLRSGLACRGKNSVLLNERMGSYFAIGEAFIDVEVDIEAGAPGVPGGAPPGDSLAPGSGEAATPCPKWTASA